MISLNGKKALVTGIANEHSVAYGCAKAFREAGADLAITYVNEKARPHVEPLAAELGADVLLPLDVQDEGQLDAMFAALRERWGRLDILLHSIAFCPKEDLHGRVTDVSRAGFRTAMEVSCFSFIDMTRRAEPLMEAGGCALTVTYFGAEKVVEHYSIMGPVKAALEGVTRYMAGELGSKGIRVHALSPGPLKTRAASGIDHFDELLDRVAAEAPTRRLATIEDVGAYATFLACDRARNVTGSVPYIDGGYNILG